MMTDQHPFKWRHFQAEIILFCVRWSLRYSLSSRDREEIMLERGRHVDHPTISRWVQRYTPELQKRCRPSLKTTNDSWRVDETSIKGRKEWMDLSRAVDFSRKHARFLLQPDQRCTSSQGVSPAQTPHRLSS